MRNQGDKQLTVGEREVFNCLWKEKAVQLTLKVLLKLKRIQIRVYDTSQILEL